MVRSAVATLHTMGQMRGTWEEPEGLRYLPDLLATEEERTLLSRLRTLDYSEVRMHGQVARRVVRHYGVDYAFESATVSPGEAIPDWLLPLRDRCADLLAVPGAGLAETLVTHYPPGATIGWHRDAPAFGEVVGVSLETACELRFQRGAGAQRRVFEQRLEPRSAYVLAGPARTRWQHSIPAVRSSRYSITFRTLRRRMLAASDN
jgi:alkylated DNA repair protein (DNA oxidative demethylase)